VIKIVDSVLKRQPVMTTTPRAVAVLLLATGPRGCFRPARRRPTRESPARRSVGAERGKAIYLTGREPVRGARFTARLSDAGDAVPAALLACAQLPTAATGIGAARGGDDPGRP